MSKLTRKLKKQKIATGEFTLLQIDEKLRDIGNAIGIPGYDTDVDHVRNFIFEQQATINELRRGKCS